MLKSSRIELSPIGFVGCEVLPIGFDWLQLPSPIALDDNVVRVFFASRVGEKSHVLQVDLEFNDEISNFRVVSGSVEIVASPGELGTYTQDGVYPSCVINVEEKLQIYSIGWEKGSEPPLFHASIGLIEEDIDQKLNDTRNSPIFDRGIHDPILVTSPFVRRSQLGYEMFYTSGIGWVKLNDEQGFSSRYHIQRAISKNGIQWESNGEIVVSLRGEETNTARPTVFNIDGTDYMLFCFATKSNQDYEMSCAVSTGETWSRDEVCLSTNFKLNDYSSYPSSISLGGKVLIFANGADRGKSGFSIGKIDVMPLT